MTWTSFHDRGEVLRAVIAHADAHRDGDLPMHVEGVAETFRDELTLLGALTLRWHTRLAGRIEHELAAQPMDLEAAVIDAWHTTADELPGVLAILEHHRTAPVDAQVDAQVDGPVARAVATSTAKEHVLLAVMAGRGSARDAATARAGADIAERARETHTPTPPAATAPTTLVDRLRAVLHAA